jgi:hypothetical protein
LALWQSVVRIENTLRHTIWSRRHVRSTGMFAVILYVDVRQNVLTLLIKIPNNVVARAMAYTVNLNSSQNNGNQEPTPEGVVNMQEPGATQSLDFSTDWLEVRIPCLFKEIIYHDNIFRYLSRATIGRQLLRFPSTFWERLLFCREILLITSYFLVR